MYISHRLDCTKWEMGGMQIDIEITSLKKIHVKIRFFEAVIGGINKLHRNKSTFK